MSDITLFAETNYRGKNRRFGVKRDDRRRHIYLIGKTGMGKTTMLEHMVYSDIINGNGLALVDPHGDFAEKMIDFIPSSRINDVIYFNPADLEWPIAFNVMEKVDPKYMPLVASGLIGVFKKIWADSWGPRLEYVLRNAILALLEYPSSTLLGVPRMLTDKTYRQKVVKKVTDPVVKAFWVDEFSRYPDKFQTEAIAPIQNKIGQFLSNSTVRNIISQTKSAINLREIMDDKKILIINLAKGRVGEDYSALLGAMMITKLQLAAMSRVDIPEPTRNDFYLYVDEFQNFATESFANILSEARKYRLNLIIAHQYIGQLVVSQNTVVRDAVFGNVGTIISFRVGAADAEFLEKEFEPVFMLNDLVNLPKYNVYMKLMIDGMTSDAFSARTLRPLGEEEKENNGEKIIKNSRQRYATPRAVIEEKIMKWSGMEDESGNSEEPIKNSANNKNNNNIKDGVARKLGTFESDRDFVRSKISWKREEAAAEREPSGRGFTAAPAEKFIEKQTSPARQNNGGGELARDMINISTMPAAMQGAAPDREQKTWHDAVCQKCLKAIQVPFVPDPSRKTYCRECLRAVRLAMQKNDSAEPQGGYSRDTAPSQRFTPQKFISLERAMNSRPVAFSAKKPAPEWDADKAQEAAKQEKQTFPVEIVSREELNRSSSREEIIKPIEIARKEEIPAVDIIESENKKTSAHGTLKPKEKVRFE